MRSIDFNCHRLPILVFLLIFLFWGMQTAIGQEAGTEENTELQEAQISTDSLGRHTPRGTVIGFIEALASRNYARASRFMDLRGVDQRATDGERLAEGFQRLLDARGNMLPYSIISDDHQGRLDDDLPQTKERVGSLHAEGETIDLYLEQTGDEENPMWLISNQTVLEIAAVDVDEALLIERYSPGFLENTYWFGVPLAHWLVILLVAAVAYFGSWLIVSVILFLLLKLWGRAKEESVEGVLRSFSLPIRLYLAVWVFVGLSERLGISIVLRQRFSGLTVIIGIVAFLILLWKLSDFLTRLTQRRMSRRGNVSGISIVLFLRRTAKVAIVVFGSISILGTLGYDVTTGLAALGIGGIALALGAQKTVENFVGSVTLVVDQPVRVGDYCKVGDTDGTVEKIGMRSTRIRTGERSTVTIPNREFSSATIENFATRDRFLFNPTIALRYETSTDQIRFLLAEIRAIMYSHPFVSPDPARIRFEEIGESSLNLGIWAYITTPGFDQYLEVKEDLLLRIMDKVKESGTDFSIPSQTLYFSRDAGISPDKAKAAEERVKQWRDKEDLPIPNFSEGQIRAIRNTIAYPPEGSVSNKK